MAEAVGVVASGIAIATLAAQIASSVVKLKSYLDQIRDAPEDISILIDEIEDVHFLLSDLEDDQRRNPYSAVLLDNHSASRCLDRCKRGVERLQRVVDEIAVDIKSLNPTKRRWNAAKVIWKRGKIEKYKAELAGALRLMTLSHQIYTSSLIQRQPEIIVSNITRLLQTEFAQEVPINPPISSKAVQVQDSSSSTRTTGRTVNSWRSKRMQTAWLQWKSRSLLVGRAWDMEIFRSQHGWDFSMSVYAVVSSDSLVAKYAYDGNVEGLKQLFSQGEASPFTICLQDLHMGYLVGKTLLDIGAEFGDLKLCEFLINEGANPGYSAGYDFTMTPIDWFLIHANGPEFDPLNYSSGCQLAGLLGPASDIAVGDLLYYSGPVSVFSALLEQVDSLMGGLPTEHRRYLAFNIARHAWGTSPDLFLMALNCNRITHDVIAEEGIAEEGEWTLLHAAAGAIGDIVYSKGLVMGDNFDGSSSTNMLSWKSIIQDLLDAGADLHAPCPRDCFRYSGKAKMDDPTTPLMSMLATLFSYCSPTRYKSNRYMGKAMSTWISVLHDYGVDLEAYGLRESLTWVNLEDEVEDDYPGFYTTVTREYDREYYRGQRRILGFNYGPSPEDWRLFDNEPTDEFVGDFWLIVDRRVEVMPGSWTE